jgi:hypothetical protein
MNLKTKAIYINVVIPVGLLLELYWGRPLYVVLISGAFLLTIANVLLLVVSKRSVKRQ